VLGGEGGEGEVFAAGQPLDLYCYRTWHASHSSERGFARARGTPGGISASGLGKG
jgi:hypothetical protein